ncbi:ABC transporter ATP-binding protein [Williamsia phyllosphaerae]|uniref:ABC transporter ATP-binding protein n=1 Tax=Williamsia phyllosphaerae TaxID=885042 RepID=A0ABQ1V2Z5_9NOCA|nr:ABC transporter ATP-binding protein [Williamsia phyllosphaerae]GGF36183.1 ABC transporter ATP-binding protein [Williamsia phyllosphaerae]
MTAVIEVQGLRKSFGRITALDGLDLTVEQGTVAGFLGPNGAGKSTTIRVLLGTYRRDAGTVRVLGADPVRDAVEVHRRIAYVPGDVDLWPQLTGGECIDALLGLRGAVYTAQARAQMIERFELDPTRRMSEYSKGNRQKVALVAAFAAHAELLILDEPTSGLDPLMEDVFTDCVREATAAGSSVLLSSHILGEVEKLCDTVTIVRSGRTVAAGSLARMRHLTRTRVTAEVAGSPDGLAELDGVDDVEIVPHPADGGTTTVSLTVEPPALSRLVAALGGLDVRSLEVSPPSLEEMFRRYYGGHDHATTK